MRLYDTIQTDASVLLLSPTNQLLLLARVKTSSSFSSAHVFPGGNLSEFHEGVPAEGPERHIDGKAYRLGAIRETFEESGILLAHKVGDKNTLLELPEDVKEAGRKAIHSDKVKFSDWLAEQGGEADVDALIPFTRWITPPTVPKRFTTQMYVYMLPLDLPDARDQEKVVHTPTHDGGLEHTAAAFDDVRDWLDKAKNGDIVIYPPQVYLLTLLGQFLTGPGNYGKQREEVRQFLKSTPTGKTEPTCNISWAEKVISPMPIPSIQRVDGKSVLSLEASGPELKGSGRAGDFDRVVLVKRLSKEPREVEVAWRADVMAEEEARKQSAAKL